MDIQVRMDILILDIAGTLSHTGIQEENTMTSIPGKKATLAMLDGQEHKDILEG